MTIDITPNIVDTETQAVLEAAADIIEGRGWTQGVLSRDHEGNNVIEGPLSDRAESFCMLSGIIRAAGDRHGTEKATGYFDLRTREGSLLGQKHFDLVLTLNKEAGDFYELALIEAAKRITGRSSLITHDQATRILQSWNDTAHRTADQVIHMLRRKDIWT